MIKPFVWPVDLSMIDLLDANENEINQLPDKNKHNNKNKNNKQKK